VPFTVSVKVCLPVAGTVPEKGGLLAVHLEFVLKLDAVQVEPADAVQVIVTG
jgi:hypothetical protein